MQIKVIQLASFLLVFFTSIMCGCANKDIKIMTTQDFVSEVKDKVAHKSVSESKALFDEGSYLFIDCRDKSEFKKGHIPGALNISRGRMEWRISKKVPNKDSNIVMYCKTGERSTLASYQLQRMGYTNVKHLNGGWEAWLKAGYPAE